MDEFNPEDALKPDTSDRRPARQQKRGKSLSAPSVSLSKQHTMIGIGIVVLVLLIIGIGSALQSPGQNSAAPASSGGGKNIDLASSMSDNQSATVTPAPSAPAAANSGAPQPLSGQPIAGTPTQAPLVPQNSNQQRIELPGNITDALSQPQQQERVNAFSAGLPTEPATVYSPPTKGGRAPSPSASVEKAPAPAPTRTQPEKVEKPSSHKSPEPKSEPKEAAHPVVNTHKTPTTALVPAPSSKPSVAPKPATAVVPHSAATPVATPTATGASIQGAPASHFTLQLSSASREDSLKTYARELRLTNYWVYETKRDGRPWYVLVNGVYASSEDAKRAISSLPADVQAKKPWVRPIRQVKQDVTK